MRFRKLARIIELNLALTLVSGCGLGYNRMLFFTKTNLGIDVDSTPPTAEISVARREAVVAPTFESGKTPAVLGGYRFEGDNFLNPRVSAVFSGGRAAVITSRLLFTDPTQTSAESGQAQESDGALCVDQPPKSGLLATISKIPGLRLLTEEHDSARPFIFATDTTTGIKVAWSGATQAIPDTFRFGYNRKEFAWAPVYGKKVDCQRDASQRTTGDGSSSDPQMRPDQPDTLLIQVPSFLATLSQRNTTIDPNDPNEPNQADYEYSQFFATGEAADALARKPEVRKILASRISSAFEKAQEAIDTARRDGPALQKQAENLINSLTTDDEASVMRLQMIAAKLVSKSDQFPDDSDIEAKKKWLRIRSQPADDEVDELRGFVELATPSSEPEENQP